MADRAPTRLVEGPICKKCGGALDIIETRRMSEGSHVEYTHRDFDFNDHKGDPIWKVIRP